MFRGYNIAANTLSAKCTLRVEVFNLADKRNRFAKTFQGSHTDIRTAAASAPTNGDRFDRAIDVQVSRLRKLLGEDPSNPRYVQTVWGLGYVFVPDGQKHA